MEGSGEAGLSTYLSCGFEDLKFTSCYTPTDGLETAANIVVE